MTGPTPPPIESAKSKLLVVLTVDTSGSMGKTGAIHELNRALAAWRTDLLAQPALRRITEIALVSFGRPDATTGTDVTVLDPAGANVGEITQPFVAVDRFAPRDLEAGGHSPMVPAIQRALEIIEVRRTELRAEGIGMAARPMVFLLTDGTPTGPGGLPTDRWADLVPRLRELELSRQLLFFALGVRGAQERVLRGLAPRSTYKVDDANFGELLKVALQSIERNQAQTNAPAETLYDNSLRFMQNQTVAGG
jgi:uncharacterized protein YegL